MEIYYVKLSKIILYFFISQISLFFVTQGRINIMLNNYFPILLFIIVSIIIGALPIIASRIINKGEKIKPRAQLMNVALKTLVMLV